ncbi:MAG TPA: PqqD family protein [Solirubrobacteraceae bacterium]|jgi:hypothetical protein
MSRPSHESTANAADLLDRRFTVPDHVVHRAFAAETVVLNLRTGGYHGLNPVAGRMLEVLERTGSPREAVEQVLAEWEADREQVEADAARLCADLLERGLVEPAEPG